ncbi:hypothetical protein PIB30_090018, partial [Stylosanthes scabra]|nr:hypothetical protein [Stylosanthes scabra]
MRSGIIYYEYEKREKFEDYDLKADAELGTFKIRRYHFNNESFVHPLHNVRFDPDRPYEILMEVLMADQLLSSSDNRTTFTRGSHCSRRSSPTPHYSPRGLSLTRQVSSPYSSKIDSFLRRRMASKEFRSPKSWELIPPSDGWMCDGDEEEKGIGGMEPSAEKEEGSKEDEEEEDPEEDPEEDEEEEDPEEEVHAFISLPMDMDADEDYLQYLEVRQYSPEYSPFHSGQASVLDLPEDLADRCSVSHGASSYDLFG